ncbi:MAG TPA: hypothetical protein VK446_05825 [Methylocystis sp.]|nr:hypothetical protein [Methylocystis sp.]
MKVKDASKEGYDFKLQTDEIHRLKDSTLDRASQFPAASAKGVLFEICIASYYVDDPDALCCSGPSPKQATELKKSIDRMLYSIAAFIEGATGARMEDACSGYFFERRHSPHGAVAKAMAEAEGRTSREAVGGAQWSAHYYAKSA